MRKSKSKSVSQASSFNSLAEFWDTHDLTDFDTDAPDIDLIVTDQQEFTNEQIRSFEEGNKFSFEFFKHLTTLSTGSVLLLTTFLEQLFKNPQWKVLLIVSIGSFIFSMIGSLTEMLFTQIAVLNRMPKYHQKQADRIADVLTTTTFLIGTISMAVFSIVNLWRWLYSTSKP